MSALSVISGHQDVYAYVDSLYRDPDCQLTTAWSRYNKFFEILTTSGLKISGQLIYFGQDLILKIPTLLMGTPAGGSKKIPLGDIHSITVLNASSCPPKLAFDWL